MAKLLLIALATAGFALLEALAHGLRFVAERRREALLRRLRQVGEATKEAAPGLLRRSHVAASPRLAQWLEGVPISVRVERLVERSGLEVTVAQIAGASVLGAAAAVALAAIIGLPWFPALGLAAGASVFPVVALVVAGERRSRALSEQLPEALDMLARSLSAGHALAGALKLVASEMPLPISLEFARAFEEQNLGLPLERAVVSMTERAPGNRDLKMLAVAVSLQKETGGNLVEILENLAETIRARYTFQRRLRTLTAEGRISALILGSLPIIMCLFLAAARSEYFSRLVDDSLGRMILAYAGTSWVLGMIWLRGVTSVEV